MKEFFHNEGIHSTTIQPEFVEAVAGEEVGHEVVDKEGAGAISR